ncbi:MAG: sodium:alanine symporter family protein [Phycisphaerae bacterium]|nr:amino acid carrier protein [Phycisphaerae bacterium]NUQ47275.1 sodium:alanine symporter family protein [Phycisphaerae bacterium]
MNDLLASLLETVSGVISSANDFLWGIHTFIALLGTGILFSVWSKFIQYRALTHGVSVIRGRYDDKNDPGAINHFQALSTALSGTVGLGNIGGVALAIGVGGPGALFWMWVTGFLGMAIKSVEVTLAMIYRDTTEPDNPHGGAMFVIDRGLGEKHPRYRVLARAIGIAFCITLLISTFTGGNMFQAWNVADITNQYFGMPQVFTGIILAFLTGLVIIGGIKRIGNVTGRLVPFMCGLYVVAGLVVLFIEAANVPALLLKVVQDAFNPNEAAGAFIGAGAWFGLTTGLRRSLFSNEAGQGSSPIAHSAAKTDEPVREGIVAGLEPFIDTCLVCTLTALVILATGTWDRGAVADIRGDVLLVRVIETPTDAEGTADGEKAPSEPRVAWIVEAPVTIDSLPTLPAPDSWEPGNGLFLLAEIPDNLNHDTASNRIRVTATIAVVADADLVEPRDESGAIQRAQREQRRRRLSEAGLEVGDKYVRWDVVSPDGPWQTPITPETQVRLLDKGVYRNFIGAALAAHAFDRAIPGLGKWLVTVAAWLFAYSTMISWAYYGEQGIIYIFRRRFIMTYKVIYCGLAVFVTLPGFITTTGQLENLADLGTGVMLFANLPIILFMGHQAMRAFRDYFSRLDSGRMESHAAPALTDVVEGRDVR